MTEHARWSYFGSLAAGSAVVLWISACPRVVDNDGTQPATTGSTTPTRYGSNTVRLPALPERSHHSGPCAATGVVADSRFESLYWYDDLGRLVQADSYTTDPTDNEEAWREIWSYDEDRLVRHELMLMDGPLSDDPLAIAWDLEPSLIWHCYLDWGPPRPRVETWTYDEHGRVSGWTSTGWDRDPHTECVPSLAERYIQTDFGVRVLRWTRTQEDFLREMPASDCINGRLERGRCDVAELEGIARAWFERAGTLLADGPGTPNAEANYKIEDGRLAAWSGPGAITSGTISLSADGLPLMLDINECYFVWSWDVSAERVVETFRLDGREEHWVGQWRNGQLHRLSDSEFEKSEVATVFEFDEYGRLTRFKEEFVNLEFGYECAADQLGPQRPSAGLPLAALANLAYPVKGRPLQLPPQLLHLGVDPNQPIAAPGLWGSGRGAHGSLEPFGRHWPGSSCPSTVLRTTLVQ